MLVSSHSVGSDGSKIDQYGPNANGILIYTSDGHFALVNTRSDLPKIASSSRDRGTPEEYKALVQGSLAYFGTYSVNEPDKVITAKIQGSTFPNQVGGADDRRIITSLTADELKFTNPASRSGRTLNWSGSAPSRCGLSDQQGVVKGNRRQGVSEGTFRVGGGWGFNEASNH